ncbi:MAG TPA: hypothetical protein VFY95_08905 [Sphingomicrobium sp.]
MSDAFAYLSVLLSIILGLAMAEILQGYGRLLISRATVKIYAPPLIWSAMMLLMATQFWWASFGLAKREHWDFAAFCAVLLQAIMMYMGSALVLPRGGPDRPVDLRAHYYREATPFFSFGLLFIALGFAKDWLLERTQPAIILAFMSVFAAITIVALIWRRPLVHEVVAPLMAVMIVLYFAFMFWRL